ncbi:hypothetical protein N8D56_11175 [Devosia sp. A8/3-2]|nr:hypothetical protein N8D56_11175 [Devosia sp. A8/3-2]
MGIGILNDQAQHLIGPAHGNVQAHGRAVIMQVNERLGDAKVIQ